MNKFFLIGIGCFILFGIVCSCNKLSSEDRHKQSKSYSDRQDFVQGKTEQQIKESFNALPFHQKQNLWVDKLEYLATQKFDTKIKQNILLLRDYVKNDFGDIQKIETFGEAISELSESIPTKDFISMFASLEDYHFSGDFVGKTNLSPKFSEYISSKIKEYKDTGEPIKPIPFGKSCNCRWCLFVEKYDITSNCEKTPFGCGFLFLQSCDKAVELFLGNISDEKLEDLEIVEE